MSTTDPLAGVLPVDKPAGPTSHDIVAAARRALRLRRIGHTGTLDPFASGLLLLCLGAATRLAEYLSGLPKRYRGTLRLGIRTTTDDPTGVVVSTSEGWRTLDRDRILAALRSQIGQLQQVPPAFSAKKIDGERAYRLARTGAGATLAPVPVHVESLEPVRIALPDIEFEIVCSAGTYIRAIARDVGELLGVGAHLVALRRIAIGQHSVDTALPPAALDDADAVRAHLLSPLAALAHLPRVDVGNSDRDALVHGRPIPSPEPGVEGTVAVASRDSLVAVAEASGGTLRPRKVFAHG